MDYENQFLTLNEAAKASGKSLMTIRKYLGLTGMPSRLPNAKKILKEGAKQETWAIPINDLFNAGLMSGSGKKPEPATAIPTPETDRELLIKLVAENENLKNQIAQLEKYLEESQANLRLILGRSIETAEKQEARRKRFWQR